MVSVGQPGSSLLQYALLKWFPAWRKLKSSDVRAVIEELQKVQFVYTNVLLYDEIIVLHVSQSR